MMKKTISIFLCLIMCLSFASCSSSLNQEQAKEDYGYSEDYISMYRANNYQIREEIHCNAIKAKNGKYYLNLGYAHNDIYELSALEFNKSCENKDLLESNQSTYASEYKYGNKFVTFNDLEDDEINLIQTYKNYLYVLINSSIYKINCNNSDDIVKIYSADNYDTNFFFYKNEMYIVNYGSIVNVIKADLNGTIISEIVKGGSGFSSARNDELYNIYASDDYLYFLMRNHEFESNTFLYCRCKLDGSEKDVWKITNKDFNYVANEKNIAIISHSLDYENNDCPILNIEIYDSKDLTLIKNFSVNLINIDDETNEWIEESFCLPMLYTQNSIQIDFNYNTYDIKEFHSAIFTINTDNELLEVSSYRGLISRASYNDIFTIGFEQISKDSTKFYYSDIENLM